MKIQFNTDEFPERKRFEVYQEALADLFCMPLDHKEGAPLQNQPFCGNFLAAQVDDIDFSRIDSMGHRVVQARAIGARRERHLQFSLQISGIGLLSQNGRQAIVRPGDLVLFETDQPFSWTFAERFQTCAINIPRDRFMRELGDADDLTVRTLSGQSELVRLSQDFLTRTLSLLGTADTASAAQLSKAALGLLGATLGQLRQDLPPRQRSAGLLLAQSRQLLLEHLHDGELSAAQIARHLGISEGYLQALYRQESSTLGDTLRQMRLERCRLALLDPRLAGRSVSEIAFMYGFNSLAHMSHRFKDAYSVSPSEYRKSGVEKNSGKGPPATRRNPCDLAGAADNAP